MCPIPHEIWLHIAQFIPVRVLLNLISVNSTFFELAMDYRYRQMSFAYLDKRMIRSLVRLRDPAVAKRVRILHVYPGFIKEVVDMEKIEPEPMIRRSLLNKFHDLANLLNVLLDQKLFMKHPRIRLIRSLKRAEDVVQVMLEVLSGLPNVTDYYVTWYRLPSISATAVPFLSTVFHHANLQKLSLEIAVENVKDLLTPAFQAQNLKELQLCIHTENAHSTAECDAVLSQHLAPAISRLQSTLEILSIQSWEPSDLFPLFLAIKSLPALDQLIIAIPVESMHLGHPRGLAAFLSANRSSLRVLRLRATQFGGQGMTPDPVSFDSWIKTAIQGVELPKLRILDISTNLFPVETSALCLHQFSSTITSLSLTGSYRSYDEMEEILDLMANESREEALSTLRIGLISLSPQIVDLLASKLPRLYKLDLTVKYILPYVYCSPELRQPGDIQRSSQIEEFITDMESLPPYSQWKLRHMSVLAEYLPYRPHYEELLGQTFLSLIPSLATFT
ncbi:hypothetical protein BDN70DRAFT_988777 [Pholiota conissans]|uniref:F-box domain-containing protein n=1 Tax=Pholiota conissans TaxID=109636 RepID=A0A9P5ZDR6_9AGAR|nr:hypothetical protein BDN70DRAFT_988777 [Pholiota conissans]